MKVSWLKHVVNFGTTACALSVLLSPFSLPVQPVKARTIHTNSAARPAGPAGTFSGRGSGELLAMTSSGKTLSPCPLKHTDVKANVSGYIAQVSVKQVFQNNHKEAIEAVYTFPLPENSAVNEMTMRIGKRIIKGDIKRREEARQIYDQARARGQTASLLDQERANIFTQSVANIPPGEQVEIEIKYIDVLPYDSGTYTFAFPTVVGPRFNPGNAMGKSGSGRASDTDQVPDASKITPQVAAAGERAGHDISIAVNIAGGVPISNVASKLHEVKIQNSGSSSAQVNLVDKASIPNKDFVLTWSAASDKLQSGYLAHKDGKSGYFTLMLMPPKRVTAENVAPKEMIFLIDCSGSQSGAPIEKAKETLDYIVHHMNAKDTFQIVCFNNDVTLFADKPQPASKQMIEKATQFINTITANGGTWMGPAVEKVCSIPADQHRLRIVTFMTDGYVGNDMEIVGMIRKLREKSRWFSFGTGNSVNRFLIDQIAKEGGGEADYVLLNTSGNEVGKKFYDRISSPVLTDVKLDFHGLPVKEVFPHDMSDVWAERPLYIKGRYTKGCAGTITLTGFAGGKPYKQDLAVTFPEKEAKNTALGAIWARAKVDRLLSEDWGGAQTGNIAKELKEEIIQTALEHKIMTQYTSFVAVDESRTTGDGKPKQIAVPTERADGVAEEAYGRGMAAPLPASLGQGRSLGNVRANRQAYLAGVPAAAPASLGMGYGSGSTRAEGSLKGILNGPAAPRAKQFKSAYPQTARQMENQQFADTVSNLPESKKKLNTDSGAGKKESLSDKDTKLAKDAKNIQLAKLDDSLIKFMENDNARKERAINSATKIRVALTFKQVDEKLIDRLKKLGIEIIERKDQTLVAMLNAKQIQALSQWTELIRMEKAPLHQSKKQR